MNFQSPFRYALKLVAICILIIGITSCAEDEVDPDKPISCISFPEDQFEARQIISFESCSENASSFSWDFGDGSTAQQENPNHAYNNPGTYEVSLTVSDSLGNEASSTKEIVIIQPSIIRHSGMITKDETWEAGVVHLITNTGVYLDNAILTIEPGTTILFQENTVLSVYNDTDSKNALIANGTESAPIIFTSAKENKSPGDWSGLNFHGVNTAKHSELSYCTIEYGGISFDSPRPLITIREGADVSFEHCTFQYANELGIELDRFSEFFAFNNNTIREIEDYAISISCNKVESLGQDNQIEDEGILVDWVYIEEDVTWSKQTAPYVPDGDLRIGSTEGATLTISEGVRIEFLSSSSLRSYGTETSATIKVNGTASDPVIFTAHDPENSTYDNWKGVHLTAEFTPDSYFHHVIFEKAEHNSDFSSVINVSGTTLNMENCIIDASKSWGVELANSATLGVYANNDIANILSYSMRIRGHHIDDIDEGNQFSSGKNIHIPYEANITETVTWRAFDVEYEFPNRVYVGSPEGNVLTLAPGVKIDGEIYIGTTGVGTTSSTSVPGGLIAVGTADQPIELTGEDVNASPIRFNAQTLPESIVSYCHIKDASMGTRVSNIYNDASNPYPRIEHSTFENIDKYGIWYGNSNPDIADNNTFINIGEADIHNAY
ncbi:PKD domain-containing protein [Marivirga salinae]|uniref:PKD domain-containing protein n=1 Tax=Marivirga salinarum TaxID=3059078 RepID=A0AA51RE58_9BACT|nr:PKD domain-containing protein [Marivirga sp. BDSF4-3]WMN11025.1 PKD domain-containing protein [Marivirga sp. BDSF4-3]